MSLSSNITRRGALGLVAGAAVIVAAGPSAALDAALSRGAARVIICGSLYLAGEILRGGDA